MNKHTFLACLLLGLLTACTTTRKDSADGGAAVEDHSTGLTDAAGGRDSTTSYATGADSLGEISALDAPQNPLSIRTIYFDYDSSTIQPQFRAVVEAHSAYFAARPNVIVVLEGHADERGSREYNLALGERRAQTVKRQMALLGVPEAQIRTTSYGEERPVVSGHDESSWSQNRRVEILY